MALVLYTTKCLLCISFPPYCAETPRILYAPLSPRYSPCVHESTSVLQSPPFTIGFSTLAHKLEPVGSAVLLVQPGLAVRELARHAALALG